MLAKFADIAQYLRPVAHAVPEGTRAVDEGTPGSSSHSRRICTAPPQPAVEEDFGEMVRRGDMECSPRSLAWATAARATEDVVVERAPLRVPLSAQERARGAVNVTLTGEKVYVMLPLPPSPPASVRDSDEDFYEEGEDFYEEGEDFYEEGEESERAEDAVEAVEPERVEEAAAMSVEPERAEEAEMAIGSLVLRGIRWPVASPSTPRRPSGPSASRRPTSPSASRRPSRWPSSPPPPRRPSSPSASRRPTSPSASRRPSRRPSMRRPRTGERRPRAARATPRPATRRRAKKSETLTSN
jgi:hypothetical protein